jgi:hypothetical protein
MTSTKVVNVKNELLCPVDYGAISRSGQKKGRDILCSLTVQLCIQRFQTRVAVPMVFVSCQYHIQFVHGLGKRHQGPDYAMEHRSKAGREGVEGRWTRDSTKAPEASQV